MPAWVDSDAVGAHLVGQRCDACGSFAFPPTRTSCPNPSCGGDWLRSVSLSRHGKVWSWTVNHYAAPPPFEPAEPFEPYGIAAVELAEERMVVLGRTAPGAAVRIGDVVEVALTPDGQAWTWEPVASDG